MKLVKEISNKKGNKKVTIDTQDGLFYCSVWVNRGETCVESSKEYRTLKSAEKFAIKRMV